MEGMEFKNLLPDIVPLLTEPSLDQVSAEGDEPRAISEGDADCLPPSTDVSLDSPGRAMAAPVDDI